MTSILPDIVLCGVPYVTLDKLEWASKEAKNHHILLDAAYKEIKHQKSLVEKIKIELEASLTHVDIANMINNELKFKLNEYGNRIKKLENPNLDYS